MLVLFAVLSILTLGGAVGAHGLQVHRAAVAVENQRQAAQRARNAELAAEAAAAEREARRAAEDAAAEKASVEEQARHNRYRAFPNRLITLRRTALTKQLAAANARLTRLRTELETLRTRRADLEPTSSAVTRVVHVAAIGLLLALAVLSLSQLVPSFMTLGTGIPLVDVLLAIGLAAVEVFVALLLADKLRPSGGFATLGAKLNLACAVVFALLVMAMQFAWAPAHDTVPLRKQIAAANEQVQVDRTSGADPLLLETDKQTAAGAASKLKQVTERDQGLALVVTLGADVAAYPALLGLGHLRTARRRSKTDADIATAESAVESLEARVNEESAAATLALQTELDDYGIDPLLAVQAAPAPAAHAPRAEQAAVPVDVVDLTKEETVPTDDLFPVGARDDRRWTDPL
jgi:hypothetical protein